MLSPQIRRTHCLPTHLELLPTCLGIFLWYNMYIYHGLLYFGIKLEILKEVQQDSTCFGCRRSQVQFLVSLKKYSDLKPWRASAVWQAYTLVGTALKTYSNYLPAFTEKHINLKDCSLQTGAKRLGLGKGVANIYMQFLSGSQKQETHNILQTSSLSWDKTCKEKKMQASDI